MKKRFLKFDMKYFTSVIVLFSLLFFILKLIRSYNGFCTETNDYIEDEKKIENAIGHVMSLYPPVTKDIVESDGEKYLRFSRAENPLLYSSVAEFKKINPNCCTIQFEGRRGFSPSFYDRLSGRLSEFVKIKYLLRYYDGNSNLVSEEIVVHVGLSNCGSIWSGF